MTRPTSKNPKRLILTVAFGILGGFINGFLGAGGGIILLWALNRLHPPVTPDDTRDNFASVVAVVLIISTVSAVTYSHTNELNTSLMPCFVIPGMAGGLAGAYVTHRINTFYLKLFFSVLLIIAGVNMAF